MGFAKVFLFPFLLMLLVPVLVPLLWVIKNGEPIAHIVPYALIFTGFRQPAIDAWKKFGAPIDTSKTYELEPLPEISAEEYTHEKFIALTENLSRPAVVRGLFKNTPAVEHWKEFGYLSSKIGQHKIPVIKKALYGTPQTNRTYEAFGPAMDELMTTDKEQSYLFFPMLSRPSKGHYGSRSTEYFDLVKDVNKVIMDDLQMDKLIFEGFGTAKHQDYVGAQFVIGKGAATLDSTTGTGWHCALGSNYFVQAVGGKRWYFAPPEVSWMFRPVRNGMVAFMVSIPNFHLLQKHVPLRFVDLGPGDMIYNPAYQWHTIQNFEGLSIGNPIREKALAVTLRNNFLFASITATNKLFEYFGYNIGGFPGEDKQHD